MMGVPPDPFRGGTYGNPNGFRGNGGKFKGSPNPPDSPPDRNYREGEYPGVGPKLGERISSRGRYGRRERARDK